MCNISRRVLFVSGGLKLNEMEKLKCATKNDKYSLKENMGFINRKLLIAAVGFITTLIGTIYSPVIDYMSGRFGGQLSLGLSSDRIPEATPTYIFFSTPNNDRDTRYAIPVNLTIFNDFKNTEENISLSIKYKKDNDRLLIDNNHMINIGARIKSEVYHEINTSVNNDYSNYRISFLSRGSTFSIGDAAFTSKVDYRKRIPVLLELGQELNVEAVLFSKGDKERKWDLRYRAINVRSDSDLETWITQYYGKYIALQLRRELSFFQYAKRLLWGDSVTIYELKLDYRKVPGQKLYAPKDNEYHYLGVRFDPYLFNLLFDFSL